MTSHVSAINAFKMMAYLNCGLNFSVKSALKMIRFNLCSHLLRERLCAWCLSAISDFDKESDFFLLLFLKGFSHK